MTITYHENEEEDYTKLSSAIVNGALIILSSADKLCKQFGPRSGPTKDWPDLDQNYLTPRLYS